MLAGVVCCDRCDQLQSFNTGQVNLHMVLRPTKLNGQAVGTKVGVLLLLKVTATPCAAVQALHCNHELECTVGRGEQYSSETNCSPKLTSAITAGKSRLQPVCSCNA